MVIDYKKLYKKYKTKYNKLETNVCKTKRDTRHEKIYDKIISTCSGLIYSSALPPGNYAAISEAIKIIPTLKRSRKKLLENSRFLIKELNKIDINTGSSNSQIIPIILGDETKCFELPNHQVLYQRIRYHHLKKLY